jgi:hypothetical protein
MAWFGLALIALAVVPLAGWTMWFHTRTWCPVDVPVSLTQGSHASTSEFAVNLNAQYAIEISAKGKIPVDDLGCLLGNDMRSTCAAPSVVQVRWALSSDGIVVQGTSDDSRGGGAVYSTGEASRAIGYFHGQKGRHYKLDLDVLADGSSLAVANPHLRVSVDDTKYESGLVLSGLLRLVCALIGLVGAVLVVSSALAYRRPRIVPSQ